MVEVATVEVAAAIEIAVIEVVAIDNRSTVRDVGVVVVDHPVAVPVASPVMPAPSNSSEVTNSKSNAEGDRGACKKDSRQGIPAWICNDRVAVDEPRIVRRHVNHFRTGRFDDDGIALIRYFLLFIAIQVAGLVSLLAHRLHGVRHILLLIGVCIAKRRSPGKVLVHIF